jgi:hypothetical protein
MPDIVKRAIERAYSMLALGEANGYGKNARTLRVLYYDAYMMERAGV